MSKRKLYKNLIFLREEHAERSIEHEKYEINRGLGFWLHSCTNYKFHSYRYLNDCGILMFSSTMFNV